MSANPSCPLCGESVSLEELRGADQRRYVLCGNCDLIFAAPGQELSEAETRAHYQTHENSIENAGYVRFLNRVVEPMLAYLKPGMRGIDYGCGPGPTLSELVRRQGWECEDYDPLFANHPLTPPYDFVFSTETFEHFPQPAEEIAKVRALIKPGGFLGIMTEFWTTREAFAKWYYTKDPTHVCFYHTRTLPFLCDRFGFQLLETDGQRVALFQTLEQAAPL